VAKAKKKAARQKRDWRIIVFLILSLLLVLAMVMGFILPSLLGLY
jgi:predicted nucleic acid-binding Zn ribbon protein